MTVEEREKWGVVPMSLAHHCQDCDLISSAPNGRCAQCGSESVAPLHRDAAEQLINGEPVILPAGAVMGAEMLAPEQRNRRNDEVL
jgi:hypothetical protein